MARQEVGLRVLVDGPLTGVRNMAVDEALLRAAPARGAVTLRFYEWSPGCLSFGRNQAARGAYDGAAATRRGIDVVRRPTGGRAVYHDRELTYSVTAPRDAWGSLRETYRRINRALARGLCEVGVQAECVESDSRRGRAPGPTDRACFADPLPGEVTAGGRKLVGSAQWRDGDALLQHGSILIADDQDTVDRLRTHQKNDSAALTGRAEATALVDHLAEVPAIEDLVAALTRGFEVEFSLRTERDSLSADEAEVASGLAAKYADPDWTWRR